MAPIIKRTLLLLTISMVFLLISSPVFAKDVQPSYSCEQGVDFCLDDPNGVTYDCIETPGAPCVKDNKGSLICQCRPAASSIKKTFGRIQPPDALKGFLAKDPTGASAISDFLSRFITLLFSVAAIVLIFMIIWGAFEWLTSGGDKEKLSSAQKRIINAIIGIILFAVAFAIIQILGTFTGFKFFKGQGVTTRQDPFGNIEFTCPNGDVVNYPTNDPDVACKGRGT